MSNHDPIIIVGAGHAGVEAASALRAEGYQGGIILLSDEPHLPYQRPPLSKAYMKRELTEEGLLLKGEAFYAKSNIDLRLGAKAEAIDRTNRQLRLASGEALAYSHLILATGARQRPFTIPGADLDGVLVLRNLSDAGTLRERLETAKAVVIIGAGFIGLEFAAVAAPLGSKVHVVELAPRAMARSLSKDMSDFFEAQHRGFGVELLFGTGVTAIQGTDGKVSGVALSDGRVIPADLVLAGIGVLAEDRLALEAGLDCGDGIIVDEFLATSDPPISAIGDCAHHPNVFAGARTRLESVQNAGDQARCVAKRLVGKPIPYSSLPWFWSDQADLKLQIVGFLNDCDQYVLRGKPEERAFSIFGFKQGKLTGVESVNQAAEHMIGRKLLQNKTALTPEQAGDPAFDLRALAGGRAR
jgi:3-phenylpropionate/trans-cinnamate dioxygenase ferredoxin reductase subunit